VAVIDRMRCCPPSSPSTALTRARAATIGRVVGVVSLGGDGRAFDVVHAGLDAALGRAEGAA
jgi:hypothetical protein